MCNDPERGQINAVAQELKQLASNAHWEVRKQASGCLVCGVSYEQALEETTAGYLQQTAEPGETKHQVNDTSNDRLSALNSKVAS